MSGLTADLQQLLNSLDTVNHLLLFWGKRPPNLSDCIAFGGGTFSQLPMCTAFSHALTNSVNDAPHTARRLRKAPQTCACMLFLHGSPFISLPFTLCEECVCSYVSVRTPRSAHPPLVHQCPEIVINSGLAHPPPQCPPNTVSKVNPGPICYNTFVSITFVLSIASLSSLCFCLLHPLAPHSRDGGSRTAKPKP